MLRSQQAGCVLLAALLVFSVRAGEPGKLVSDGATVIAVINVKQLLDAPLLKKTGGRDKLVESMKTNADAKKFMEATGIDPLKDIDTITVSSSAVSPDAKPLIVVRGNFTPKKIADAAAEFAKANPEKLVIESKGGRTVYQLINKPDNSKTMYATFLDKGTLIVAQSADDALAAGKGAKAKSSAELTSALEFITGKESIYVAVVATDELRKMAAANPKMKELAPKVLSFTGFFDLKDDFKIDLSLHLTDAKAADQVKNMINGFLPALGFLAASNEQAGPVIGDVLKKIEVKKDKTNVSVKLKLTEEMLKDLEKAGAAAGGGGGLSK